MTYLITAVVTLTTMIGFVTWPPLLGQVTKPIIHSLENNPLTVVHKKGKIDKSPQTKNT